MIRGLLLMILACFMLMALALPALIFQVGRYLARGMPLALLFYGIAVGLDHAGASIIYDAPGWTISSRTWWLAQQPDNRPARIFERVIDWFFGAGHCRRAYVNEGRSLLP